MRVLVTAASRHGATHEIGTAIADGLKRRGVEADFRAAEEPAGLDGYDAFVIGSAVYVGRWLDAAKDLVGEHARALAGAPVWLFSSGPLGPPEALKPEGDPVDVDPLIDTVTVVEHRVFAGRLDRKLLSFGEKALVVAVRAPDGDFRDWQAIDGFAGEIAAHLQRDRSLDALRMARAHRPDVLVLDLTMPGGSSLEAIPTIREQAPMTAIVVLTMQNDPAFARQALQAGALGFVLKEAADDELLGAIRLAAEGETYLNPRLGARLAAQPPEPAGPPDDLSDREVEVLRLIALGHTNAEIAGRLYLSVRTVESHRAHIQQKTRRSSRAELVRYALTNGLVELNDS